MSSSNQSGDKPSPVSQREHHPIFNFVTSIFGGVPPPNLNSPGCRIATTVSCVVHQPGSYRTRPGHDCVHDPGTLDQGGDNGRCRLIKDPTDPAVFRDIFSDFTSFCRPEHRQSWIPALMWKRSARPSTRSQGTLPTRGMWSGRPKRRQPSGSTSRAFLLCLSQQHTEMIPW